MTRHFRVIMHIKLTLIKKIAINDNEYIYIYIEDAIKFIVYEVEK
jgi:hypothetical protein